MAVDPVTAKLLTQATITAATDKESRQKILLIVLTPVIGFLSLVALILYLITSSLAIFAQWLAEDEIALVERFQKDYGYNQTIGIYDTDYVIGSGQNYDGILFSDNETDVVYYNQLDERWADKPYGSDKIGTHGCGPTAMAIVVSSLTPQAVDPINMAQCAYDSTRAVLSLLDVYTVVSFYIWVMHKRVKAVWFVLITTFSLFGLEIVRSMGFSPVFNALLALAILFFLTYFFVAELSQRLFYAIAITPCRLHYGTSALNASPHWAARSLRGKTHTRF